MASHFKARRFPPGLQELDIRDSVRGVPMGRRFPSSLGYSHTIKAKLCAWRKSSRHSAGKILAGVALPISVWNCNGARMIL